MWKINVLAVGLTYTVKPKVPAARHRVMKAKLIRIVTLKDWSLPLRRVNEVE